MAQKQGKARIDSLLEALPHYKPDTSKVVLLGVISFNYSKINSDEGLKYAQQQFDLAQELEWKKGIALAYNNLGMNYISRSDYPKALDNYFKALKIDEEIQDKHWMGKVIGNVALVYYREKNYDTALSYIFRSLDVAGQTHDTLGMQSNLGNIGIMYEEKGEYQKSLEYLLKAVSLAKSGGDRGYLASEYGNIANTYTSLKNYPKALQYSFKAMHMGEELNYKQTIAINCGNIGAEYLQIAIDSVITQPDSLVPASKAACLKFSILYLAKAIALCKELSFNGPIEEFAMELSKAYETEGNYKAALDAYKQYTVVKDTIYSIANNVKITNLETERAVQLKDKDIYIAKLEILKKRNERGFFIAGLILMLGIIIIIFRNYKRQKHTNDLLVIEKEKVEQRTVALNDTNLELNTTLTNLKETQRQLIITENQKENGLIRSRIAMDIHDDISSELTRMSWLSELVKLKFKKSDVAEVSALLDKITSASRQTIGNLQEIIWTVKPENDNVEELMAHIRNHVAKFFTDTVFSYTIDFPELLPSMHINPELKRNLFLVVKEALNNVAKYSQAMHVVVSFRLEPDNHYMLTVLDDGKGIDKNVVEGGGNGLKNMQNRMADINGACTIQSQPGQGTRITFEGMLY